MHERDMKRLLKIGAAIERAAEELPDGYDIMIEIEKHAGTVTLLIPPVSDEEGGKALSDWDADCFGAQIDAAIDRALEHHRANAAQRLNSAAERPLQCFVGREARRRKR